MSASPPNDRLAEHLLTTRFREAREDATLAVLEGFHPLKHALRFGAEIEAVAAVDPDDLERLAAKLAPDLAGRFAGRATRVTREAFRRIAPLEEVHTRVAALARRPPFDTGAVLAAREAPVVLLEDPRNRWNVGAVVRVAAAAGAAGVLTTGDADPWNVGALRGSAGLHFALPVGRVAEPVETGGRPLVALDGGGAPLDPSTLPPDALLAFGSERHGLSAGLLDQADERVRIPMREGVSSLNLATAVATVLYAWRFSSG